MEIAKNQTGKLKLARRAFMLEFKAVVVQHKLAENLTFTQTGAKFDLLPKLEVAPLVKTGSGYC